MKESNLLLDKIKDKVLDKIITLIITGVLFFIVTGSGSLVDTGDWWGWFASISVRGWVILASIFVAWFSFIAIHRRRKNLRKENSSFKPLKWQPRGGWETIHKIEYAGVVWQVRVPVRTSTFRGREVPTLDDLDIEIPPRCPDCGTKLEGTKSFWGWFVWKCVNADCGFRKRNRDDFFRKERRVIKLAERWFEETYQSQVR